MNFSKGCSALTALCLGVALPAAAFAADDPASNPPALEPAQAADTADAPPGIETITVEASPFRRAADDIVQPVKLLSGEELDRKRRATIGEVLENEPGVATSDFGPGVGRPIIRGQAGARVSVLENGIGSMDVSTISGDHAVGIDANTAQQIEIIKGPATLIYGSAASAGVVNVVNDRLPDAVRPGLKGIADLSYGDNADERLGRLDLDYGAGLYQLHADLSGRETHWFEVPENAYRDGSAPDSDHIPNSAVESASGALSLSRIAPGGSFGLAVSRFETEYGLPQEEQAFIDLEQTRGDFQGRLNAPLQGLEWLHVRVGMNDYEHTEFEAPGVAGTRFENDEIEGRVEALHEPLAGFRGVLGVQVIARDFEAIGEEAFVPAVETRSIGVFLVEEREFSRGRFEIGARVEQQDHELQNEDERPDADHRPLSFSAGVIYELDADYHLRLNLASAQRAPAAEELYAFGPHLATSTFERGDIDLDEESSNNVELGIDKHHGPWTWGASVYYTQIDDYIFLREADEDADGVADRVTPEGEPAGPDEIEALLLVDYRQDDAKFTGFEAETAYRFQIGPVEMSGRIFADLVRAELDSGSDLPRITPARFGAGLDARKGAFSGSLNLTRVDEQDHVAPLERATSGYTLLSADLGYTLAIAGGTTTFYLRGRNLLDEEARRHTSFLKDFAPLPGATLILGVNLRFD